MMLNPSNSSGLEHLALKQLRNALFRTNKTLCVLTVLATLCIAHHGSRRPPKSWIRQGLCEI